MSYTIDMLKYGFLIVQSILYIAFIVRDFSNQYSSVIKYISLVLCFVYALVLMIQKKEKTRKWIAVALFLTVIADYLFMILDDYYAIAVSLFCVVETIYALIIGDGAKIIIRFMILCVIYLLVFVLNLDFDLTAILSLYSFIFLLTNFLFSFKLKNPMFTIGLGLFMLCDLSVGLYNISDYFAISKQAAQFLKIMGDLIWIFYLPSQILIVFSGGINRD